MTLQQTMFFFHLQTTVILKQSTFVALNKTPQTILIGQEATVPPSALERGRLLTIHTEQKLVRISM